MTATDILPAISEIVADLSRELPPETRFQRLLDALMRSFPCDAASLLQHEGDCLVPRAIKGLSRDTLARSFRVAEQPRLKEILQAQGTVRFPPDSRLPDPFDGLIDAADGHIHVHDCMGAPLLVDGRIWGVITMDALEKGAFLQLDRQGFDMFVRVAAATIRAAEVIHSLEDKVERQQLVQQASLRDEESMLLIGDSAPIQRLRQEALVAGRADIPVLIDGESGVGKELVAQLVHRHSPRAGKVMVHVNCAALPEEMAESELFGHVSGAFSGATRNRAGKFELADEGTLLLDEIGELPLALQPKLLRVLQSGELQRVGSDRSHHADVRIIAATNRNLMEEVRRGRFREDLFHRLNVYPITVPPLRERDGDILLLAGQFMQRCERRLGLRGLRLTSAARQWVNSYPWPGNVRELEHAITRAAVRALSDGVQRDRVIRLTPVHLGALPDDPPVRDAGSKVVSGFDDSGQTLAEATDEFRRMMISKRLARHDNNLAATARSLGIDRGNFHRLLDRLGLR